MQVFGDKQRVLAPYNSIILAAAWLAPGNPLSDYWRRNTDPAYNPFRGVYQLNSFDLAIMLPYFFVMIILAAYLL